MSDVYAAEFMHFLQEQGISVPGDVSVVGFDDNALCENTFPRLSTVGQDAGARAQMAVRALQSLREDGGGEMTRLLPVYLVRRDSVRNLADKGSAPAESGLMEPTQEKGETGGERGRHGRDRKDE